MTEGEKWSYTKMVWTHAEPIPTRPVPDRPQRLHVGSLGNRSVELTRHKPLSTHYLDFNKDVIAALLDCRGLVMKAIDSRVSIDTADQEE